MNSQNRYKPYQVGIELVKGCNFSCQMCPVPLYREENAWEFISLELLEKLVSEIEENDSVKVIWLVHFGEPLAHPKLRECFSIINRVHNKFKRRVILHTNASLLKGEKIEALLDIPAVTELTFSFDGFGDKESFEFLRGKHFDKVIQNIRYFSAQAHVRRPDLKLSTCSVVPKADELKGWEGPIPSTEEVLQNYKNLFEPLKIIVHPRPMIDFSGNEILPIMGQKADRVFGGCHFVEKDSLYFTVTGKAQPCCNVFNEEFNVGDIQQANFDGLLNSEAMNGLRHALRLDQRENLAFCKNCSLSNGRQLSAEQLSQLWVERHTAHPLEADERQHIFGLVDPGVLNDAQMLLNIWQQRQQPKLGTEQRSAPSGHIDTVIVRGDSVNLSGWAADDVDESPLTSFSVFVDGQAWAIDQLNYVMRSDVAASLQRNAWKFSGFSLDISDMQAGEHQLLLRIANSAGLQSDLLAQCVV